MQYVSFGRIGLLAEQPAFDIQFYPLGPHSLLVQGATKVAQHLRYARNRGFGVLAPLVLLTLLVRVSGVVISRLSTKSLVKAGRIVLPGARRIDQT